MENYYLKDNKKITNLITRCMAIYFFITKEPNKYEIPSKESNLNI